MKEKIPAFWFILVAESVIHTCLLGGYEVQGKEKHEFVKTAKK